jgi:putative ABC transport system substrate-binding protein
MKNIQAASKDIGLAVTSLTMRHAEDLAPLFATNAGKPLGSMYTLTSNTTFRLWPQIGDFALANRLPTVCEFRQMAQSGCLLSYGPSLDDITERCAALIDKILRGTPPGELPIERPTRFELVVNLKIANALGITVPQSIVLRADEVIQ